MDTHPRRKQLAQGPGIKELCAQRTESWGARAYLDGPTRAPSHQKRGLGRVIVFADNGLVPLQSGIAAAWVVDKGEEWLARQVIRSIRWDGGGLIGRSLTFLGLSASGAVKKASRVYQMKSTDVALKKKEKRIQKSKTDCRLINRRGSELPTVKM